MRMASLEHGNQVSSLTTEQSIASDDGTYWYMVANEAPGHASWLDAGMLRRGTMMIRWDGVQDTLEPDQYPSAGLISIGEIEKRIPGIRPVTLAAREATRAGWRAHR